MSEASRTALLRTLDQCIEIANVDKDATARTGHTEAGSAMTLNGQSNDWNLAGLYQPIDDVFGDIKIFSSPCTVEAPWRKPR